MYATIEKLVRAAIASGKPVTIIFDGKPIVGQVVALVHPGYVKLADGQSFYIGYISEVRE